MRKSRTRPRATREGSAALRRLERLEPRQLLSISPGAVISAAGADDASAAGGCPICGTGCCRHTTAAGLEYVACRLPAADVVSVTSGAGAAVAVTALDDTFRLHSRPSATKKIYLDFDGHLTTGTPWGLTIDTPAYSLDANFSAFSDAEKTNIQAIWARVAEDFIVYDVDVTTEAPPVDDLRNTGGSDTRWGIRVVIGGDGSWRSGAAGVAFIGSFSWNSDTPCFAFAGQSWKSNVSFASTVISHEVGHTLGLGHDGINGSSYYGGRGSGVTSWGPLMGNPSRPLTQWSNGDYGGATNKQDDLTVMTGYGFGFRPDDHGDSFAAATLSPTANFAVTGIIGRRTDVDMFGFTTPGGDLAISVKPLAAGANLDVLATLYDAAGTVVATSNPAASLEASFRQTLAAGTYFIAVDGAGFGDPATTGYSDYGSLGQYTVTVGDPVDPLPMLSIADVAVTEGDTGSTTAQLTVTLSAASAAEVTVAYATADWTATVPNADYLARTGTLTFAPGETTKTIAVQVRGDTAVEADEIFFVRLSTPANALLGRDEASVTITDDDGVTPPEPPAPPAVSLAVTGGTVLEGSAGKTAAVFTFALSATVSAPVTITCRVEGGTATSGTDYDAIRVGADGTLQVTIPAYSRSVTLPVRIVADSTVEPSETIRIAIVDYPRKLIGTAPDEAIITIVDDDRVEVNVTGPATVAEGNAGTKNVGFDVVLSRPVNRVTKVDFAIVAGTATAGQDYRASTQRSTLVFSPSRQVIRVNVAVVGDRLVEDDETFRVVLSSPVGAELGAAADKTVTIVNDDASPIGAPGASVRQVLAPAPARSSLQSAWLALASASRPESQPARRFWGQSR